MTEKVKTDNTDEITPETEAAHTSSGDAAPKSSAVEAAAALMKAIAEPETLAGTASEPEAQPEPDAQALGVSKLPEVPSLAKLANRLAATATQEDAATTENDDAKDVEAVDIRDHLETLKAHTSPDHKEFRHEDRVDTFQSVEDALSRLSNEIDGEGTTTTATAPSTTKEVAAPEPVSAWSDGAAEELISHCETSGIAEAPNKDNLLLGGDDVQGPDAPTGYVYLQPNAQEIGQQWFEDRFEELAQRFDGGALNSSTDGGNYLTPLMDKLDNLEARVETAISGQAGGSSMHDIELCIAEIATQLESTTTQLGRIESLESQISKVAEEIATPRTAVATDGTSMLDMAVLADLVAEKVGTNSAALTAHSGGAIEPGEASSIGELSTVMREFIRERRSEGEHANAVLDTMQQTIIRVLDRMEALETNGARGLNTMPHAPAPSQSTSQAAAASTASNVSFGKGAAPDKANEPEPAQTRNSAASTANTEAEETESLDRLQRAIGKLDDDQPSAEAQIDGQELQADEAQPAPRNSRADFIAAARKAATRAHVEIPDEDAEEPVETERTKFATAARKAAAKANDRLANDDIDAEEIDATHDGFSLSSVGASLPSSQGKNSGRARLLVAVLAVVAIGLGATKLMTSLSGNGDRQQLQSNGAQQQGSSQAGNRIAPRLTQQNGRVAPEPRVAREIVQKTAHAPPAANVQPGTVAYGTTNQRLVQPAAIAPTTAPDNGAVSGQANTNSRKTLPSALVGPLSLRLAAANGDPSAEFQVAARFADGKGVKQDFSEAIKWYKRSAGRGFALAQYRLGTLYERGLGVEKDSHRARVWYERAASQDNIKAMHNLAVLAASVNAGKPDYATAAKWFTKAAEHGLGDSQFNLAILHQNGLGVAQDEGIAYIWFRLAAQSGDKEAIRRMTEIASSMGKSKVSALDKDVREWVRKPSEKMANDPHFAGQAWQRQG